MQMECNMPRVLAVFGTRPEAIKMAPICIALRQSDMLQCITCNTAQHRDLIDPVIQSFQIKIDFDLNIMGKNQDLFDVTTKVIGGLKSVIEQVRPDVVLVHGDTTTTFAAAVAAFYSKVAIGHVEAGLRTYDKYNPFPEEVNRRSIANFVDFHFAPTQSAARNLLTERISSEKIFITGNTGLDALRIKIDSDVSSPTVLNNKNGRKLVLITAHRRENFGVQMENALRAIGQFLKDRQEEFFGVFPVHPNPNVRKVAFRAFEHVPNIELIEPREYDEMVALMRDSHVLVTDSGGIQEEGPFLKKPLIVLRNESERPEGIEAGNATLVGTHIGRIRRALEDFANANSPAYQKAANAGSPYGDGFASTRIINILEAQFGNRQWHKAC